MGSDEFSDVPVGKDLAVKVAEALKFRNLLYQHRDYCGVGLICEDNRFCYVRVFDGDPVETVRDFDSQEDFIGWLSGQTNNSLCGSDEQNTFYRNNQRLTLDRLKAFVLRHNSK